MRRISTGGRENIHPTPSPQQANRSCDYANCDKNPGSMESCRGLMDQALGYFVERG